MFPSPWIIGEMDASRASTHDGSSLVRQRRPRGWLALLGLSQYTSHASMFSSYKGPLGDQAGESHLGTSLPAQGLRHRSNPPGASHGQRPTPGPRTPRLTRVFSGESSRHSSEGMGFHASCHVFSLFWSRDLTAKSSPRGRVRESLQPAWTAGLPDSTSIAHRELARENLHEYAEGWNRATKPPG